MGNPSSWSLTTPLSHPFGAVISHPGLWRAKHTRQFGPQNLSCKAKFTGELCNKKVLKEPGPRWKSIMLFMPG